MLAKTSDSAVSEIRRLGLRCFGRMTSSSLDAATEVVRERRPGVQYLNCLETNAGSAYMGHGPAARANLRHSCRARHRLQGGAAPADCAARPVAADQRARAGPRPEPVRH